MTVVAKKERVKGKAFTLIELMIVVIIIGILATLAMPMFPRAIESTKAKEAVAALQQIRTGERIYRVEENTFWGPSSGTEAAEIQQINGTIRTFLDYRGKRNWNYEITSAGATDFTATATRKGGGSTYDTKTVTLTVDVTLPADQREQWDGTWPLPLPID